MTILGASGFIGRHLTAALRRRGDDVVATSLRDPVAAAFASSGSDAVVNLAGAPVSVRWTDASKRAMRASRVDLPRRYLDQLATAPDRVRPPVYVSASAVGYYGVSRTATFVESSPAGTDVLARLCADWEAVANGAASLGMRVATVRTGLVLGTGGGVLAKILPLFRAGLGGPIASGRQWYSWIHIEDQVGIYLHAIDGPGGALNGTAPRPVTNREFTHELGRALRRPTCLPVPGFAPALLLGEGAYVVNEGQRVLPERTEATGYAFRYRELAAALAALFEDGSAT